MNFSLSEFKCPCGGNYCSARIDKPSQSFISGLQLIRSIIGEPIKITSGMRCPSHNTNIPGAAPNSFHVPLDRRPACAADIRTYAGTPADALRLYAIADQVGMRGIGLYGGKKSRIHVDMRPKSMSRARWVDKSWVW